MGRILIIVAFIAALVLVGMRFFSAKQQKPPTSPQPTQAMKIMTSPTSAVKMDMSGTPSGVMSGENATSGEKVFTVTGQNFSFTPSTLTVKKGDKVKVTFKNSGGIHDFVIDEYKVATKKIQSGDEETVEFTADKAGTYKYYCSVGQHRQMGMEGTLTVE